MPHSQTYRGGATLSRLKYTQISVGICTYVENAIRPMQERPEWAQLTVQCHSPNTLNFARILVPIRCIQKPHERCGIRLLIGPAVGLSFRACINRTVLCVCPLHEAAWHGGEFRSVGVECRCSACEQPDHGRGAEDRGVPAPLVRYEKPSVHAPATSSTGYTPFWRLIWCCC